MAARVREGVTLREKMESAVDRALDFLQREQLDSGQFPMEFTVRENKENVAGAAGTYPEKSPFCTSYIAGSLLWCEDARASRMVQKAATFLENEKVRGGLWRYWCKDAPLHSQIPPDVDDTACISDLLRTVSGIRIANEDLLIANRSPRGLFYTWIVPRRTRTANLGWWWIVLTDLTWGRMKSFWNAGAARDDVDSVVNANVVHYLSRRVETEAAIRWLHEIAQQGLEKSSDKWYRSTAAFYYAVSRSQAKQVPGMSGFEQTLQRSLEQHVFAEANDLELGMLLCSLLNLEMNAAEQRRIAERLLASQDEDGGWASFPIYFDGRDEPLISWGSRAVTTGFCVEALVRAKQVAT